MRPTTLRIGATALAGIGLAWAASAILLACTHGAPWRGYAPAGPTGPRIDHVAHMDKGLECATCHTENAVPGDAAEPRKPTYAACKECHDEEDAKLPEEKKVKNRFFDASGNPAWERASMAYGGDVIFRHAPHAKAGCVTCHGDMKGPQRFEGWLFSMESCMACHAQRGASNECGACHTSTGKDTEPDSHRHLWKQRHGQLARSPAQVEQGRCAVCHDRPTFCDRCHRDEPPPSHTNLWRTRAHGVMAAIDRASCKTCHTTDYCVRCHEDTPPRSHRGGWVSGPTRHCIECHFPITSKDQSCSICHREEPEHPSAPDQPASHVPGMNCRLCHQQSGGGGGAPNTNHPDNGTQCERCHH